MLQNILNFQSFLRLKLQNLMNKCLDILGNSGIQLVVAFQHSLLHLLC